MRGEEIDLDIKIAIDEHDRRHHPNHHRLARFDLAVGPVQYVAFEEREQMADLSVTLTDSQSTTLRASGGADAAGFSISGVTFAFTSGGSVVGVTDNGDGTAAVKVTGVGTDSSSCTGTAPDGSSVTSNISWTVTAGPLASFDLSADAPA